MHSTQKTQLLAFADAEPAMADLAKASGIASVTRAAEVHTRLTPVVVETMAVAGRSPAVVQELLVAARGLTWVERASPEVLFKNDIRAGHGLTRLIFGDAISDLVSTVASTEGLTESNAGVLLEVLSAVTLSVMAGRPDGDLSLASLAAALATDASEPPTLVAGVSEDATIAASAPVVADVDVAPVPAVSGPTVHSMQEADEPKPKTAMLVGAALAIVAVVGIGIVVFGGGSEDPITGEPEPIAFDADGTETISADADSGEADDIDVGQTDSTEEVVAQRIEDDVQPIGVAPDKLALSVPMLDIESPGREASGVLNFNFDTGTGEVCYSVESSNIAGPYRSHIHVGGYGVKGGIVVDLGLLESGEIGCVENLPIDTETILADRSGYYAELHDISEEWTIRGQLSETIDGDIVSLSVPMLNADGSSPDASGVLDFGFDTVTGEVCYSVESTNIQGPYRSHIHVGDAGVKGGIVVDLGLLESGEVGCVDNLPTDTNAILAAKAGHYAELHDISEEWTIRGQLSQTIVVANAADQEAAQVDTAGGGASIVLDGGTVFLEGAVPDQATADELFDSLSGIDAATPVVNNLTVDVGAPLPSGRVVIADAVFFDVASDQVKAIDDATLAAITALALSRDDWILTVVGHTDSNGSDVSNLELSLRRATALRNLLASEGVPDESLRIRGAGETAPIGDNATDAGRAENRRIEFEFTPSS